MVKYISSISLNLDVVACFRIETNRDKVNCHKEQAAIILFGKIKTSPKEEKKEKKEKKARGLPAADKQQGCPVTVKIPDLAFQHMKRDIYLALRFTGRELWRRLAIFGRLFLFSSF